MDDPSEIERLTKALTACRHARDMFAVMEIVDRAIGKPQVEDDDDASPVDNRAAE